MPICPDCHSSNIKKNGFTHYRKQNHRCKSCGRQFVLDNQHTVDETLREIARRALLERISLRGICRLIGVSLTWMMDFAVKTWAEAPEDLGCSLQLPRLKTRDHLQILAFQLDEMWSFVGRKQNKAWIWVIYEPDSQQVLAFHIGDRSNRSARKLWEKVPDEMKQYCYFETDYWEAYQMIIPPDRHIVGKEFTFLIEGFFTGVRNRVSRLVRKSIAYSKKWENHVAAIQSFFWQINLERQPYI